MPKINFYYDESGHSRKITSATILDENYKNYYCGNFIGIKEIDIESFEKDYTVFEEKWKSFYTLSKELKSDVLKKEKYTCGFASFKKDDIQMLTELCNIALKYNIYFHHSLICKIEFLVIQLLKGIELPNYMDTKVILYSMSKIISVYRPKKVFECIDNEDKNFLIEFKNFLIKRKKLNTRINKESENSTIEVLLNLFDKIDINMTFDWNYNISFYGFKLFLEELNINNYSLLIDKEGNGKTLAAAKEEGIKNAKEEVSDNSIEIRCADMFCGIISNMINSIELELGYNEDDESRNQSLLSERWFKINELTFNFYKLIKKAIVDLNESWYKIFASSYGDSILFFIGLLKYFESYETYEEYKKISFSKHQQKLNTWNVTMLNDYHKRISGVYTIEPFEELDSDTYLNQKGALCYIDYKKHSALLIPKNSSIKYFVLSVGFFGKREKACITISENGKPMCYLLPDDLMEWSETIVSLAMIGQNFFPEFVIFSNKNGKNYADIE